VRECIRGGELNAFREEDSDGRGGWVVELPDDGWVSAVTAMELSREFSPWWWGTVDKTGYIHYVESLSASSWEETVPQFLCGEVGDNIWAATDLHQELLCLECQMRAMEQGLPKANPEPPR
jgi:hypothetical protein